MIKISIKKQLQKYIAENYIDEEIQENYTVIKSAIKKIKD